MAESGYDIALLKLEMTMNYTGMENFKQKAVYSDYMETMFHAPRFTARPWQSLHVLLPWKGEGCRVSLKTVGGRGCRASLKTVVLSWRLHLILGCGWNGRLSPGFFRCTEWHNLIIYWNIKEDFYLLFKEERIVGQNDEAISTGPQASREWRS